MKGLKMRVPDVPAYLAMPRACGANTAPIAFAEVYLALQNGTVEAQENPLTTIEAKKFYEVQKHIVLTGHIVDHLNTIISKSLWNQLSEEDRKIFTEVAQEAAERATKKIQQREAELVQFFKDKGLEVIEVNKQEFIDAVHEERDLRAVRLPQGRLGPHRGRQAGLVKLVEAGPGGPARRLRPASPKPSRTKLQGER